MLEYVKSTTLRLPVILKDTNSNPIVGAQYNAVSFTIIKNDGTQFDLSLVSASWMEITGAAYSGQGYYNYFLTGTYSDVTGIFQYAVTYTGSVPFFGDVKIVDGDTGAVFNRLGAPNYGSIANDIANVGVTAGSGGFTSADRAMISATYHTTSFLPADPASQSGVLAIVTQSFWTGDRQNLTAIKAKTDNLPTDPASNSTINGYIGSAQTAINNNTNSGFTQIKGGGWSSNAHTLQIIAQSATLAAVSGATQAYLSSVFGTITGVGFITGSDDLHSLSVAIQGITPGSGGGGFSTTDRANLNAIYTATLPLPSDPASNSFLSSTIRVAREQIQGLFPYGATTGTSITALNIFTVNGTVNSIKSKTDFIQSTDHVATQIDVNNARDYLAGAGFVAASDTLHIISTNVNALAFSSSFLPSDRTMIANISNSVGFGLSGTTNGIGNTVTLIKNKTDNLPADPVSTAHIDPILNQILSASAVSGGFSDTDRTNIVAIKAKTDNLPAQPADAAVTFGTSDRNQLQAIYSKTSNLPVDPVSTTYVSLVSQSLSIQLAGVSGAVSSSQQAVLGRLGVPASSTVSADIAAVYIQAANAYTAATTADAHAQQAITAAQAASAGTVQIQTTLGTPMFGSVSADISATYDAVLNVSASFSGTISASVDFRPIYTILGKPVKSLADDIRETARIASVGTAAATKVAGNF